MSSVSGSAARKRRKSAAAPPVRPAPGPKLGAWNRARRGSAKSDAKMTWIGIGALLGGCVLFAALVSGSAGAAASGLHRGMNKGLLAAGFQVREISVPGIDGERRAQALALAAVPDGAMIFAVDLDAARRRLETASWVQRARVARRLPDRIVLEIETAQPQAIVRIGKDHAVVDADGAVLDASPAQARQEGAGLPVIEGDGAADALPSLLEAMAPYPDLRARIALFSRVSGQRWRLHLAGGCQVELPEIGVEAALAGLAQLCLRPDLCIGEEKLQIDLRKAGLAAIAPLSPRSARPAASAQLRGSDI